MTTPADRRVVEVQIGRSLRADVDVAFRCHLGLPAIVKVPPVLEDGTPFPTLYWLSCPLMTKRIGRLEASGGVRRMDRKAEADPEFAAALDRAHEEYRAERDLLLSPGAEPAPTGGIGGARAGVKCLHAHYAHTRSGAENPVGALVAGWVEPFDCPVPCVVDGEPNPDWKPLP